MALLTFHAPYAGGFFDVCSKHRDVFHGLRLSGTGSAPSCPAFTGLITTLQASLYAADCQVAPPRFDAGLSTGPGGFTTGDLGVSPDRTCTG